MKLDDSKRLKFYKNGPQTFYFVLIFVSEDKHQTYELELKQSFAYNSDEKRARVCSLLINYRPNATSNEFEHETGLRLFHHLICPLPTFEEINYVFFSDNSSIEI